MSSVLEIKWSHDQIELSKKLITEDQIDWTLEGIKLIGGVDMSFLKEDDTIACVCLVVLAYPSLEIVYKRHKLVELMVPYIPTFLAFREVDPVLELIQELEEDQPDLLPEVILVDGNGLLHPRKFGLACHLGVLSGLPTIGVSKNFFVLDGIGMMELKEKVENECHDKGDFVDIVGESGTKWGRAVLTGKGGGKKPVYVSIGHRVGLETATKLVVQSCRFKNPEPVRQADLISREVIRGLAKHSLPEIRAMIRENSESTP